jgi:YqaJ-like recombinase protein
MPATGIKRPAGISTGIYAVDLVEWLYARLGYLTASNVAIAAGVSKHKTREQLLMEQAGLAESTFEETEHMEIGQYLEQTIAQIAEDRFGWCLELCGELIVDDHCPSLAATPDYLMWTPWGLAVVQVKSTTGSATEDINETLKDGSPSKAMWAGGPPLDYFLQVQTEMACTGAALGCLLVGHFCKPGFKIRSYPVLRHEAAIVRIRETADAFMRDVNRLKQGQVA